MPKSHIVQLRLDDVEYRIFQQKCQAAGMTASTMLRAALEGSKVKEINHDREIMASVCRIETLLNTLDDLPVSEDLRKELNAICRYLR